MKNKKILSGLIVAVVIGSFLLGITSCKKKEPETIKIGAILPLTGTLGVFGEEIKNTLDLALTEINSIEGKKLEILYEDCKGDPKDAVSAYNKLVKINKANIIISFTTPLIEPLIPLAKKDDVLLLALTIYPGVVNNPVTVRIFYDVYSESEKLTNYIAKKLKLENIVFIRCNDAASEYQVREYFIPMLKNANVEIIKDISYAFREKDFKKIVTPLPENVEGIIILGFGIDFPGVLRELVKYNYLKSKHILGGVGFWEVPEDCPPQLLEGIVFAAPAYLMNLAEIDFSKKYLEMYGKLPYYISPYVYDNLKILYNVLKETNFKLKTGIKLKEEIVKIKSFEGVSGKIEILPNGDSRVPISLLSYGSQRKINLVME
jgi:branched-chain amino acid transport system substrate-binding protein